MKNQKVSVGLLFGLASLVCIVLIMFILNNQVKNIPQTLNTQQSNATITNTPEPFVKNEGWKEYKNEKWGVRFEYPTTLSANEHEIDYLKTEGWYNFSVSLRDAKAQAEKNDLSAPILLSFDVYSPHKYSVDWYPNLQPRETVTINNNKWKVYDAMTCEKDAPDKSKCYETSGYLVETYILENCTKGYTCRYMLIGMEKNSEAFQRIIHSFSIQEFNK